MVSYTTPVGGTNTSGLPTPRGHSSLSTLALLSRIHTNLVEHFRLAAQHETDELLLPGLDYPHPLSFVLLDDWVHNEKPTCAEKRWVNLVDNCWEANLKQLDVDEQKPRGVNERNGPLAEFEKNLSKEDSHALVQALPRYARLQRGPMYTTSNPVDMYIDPNGNTPFYWPDYGVTGCEKVKKLAQSRIGRRRETGASASYAQDSNPLGLNIMPSSVSRVMIQERTEIAANMSQAVRTERSRENLLKTTSGETKGNNYFHSLLLKILNQFLTSKSVSEGYTKIKKI